MEILINFGDSLDRLIDANFYFKYDKENDCIIFNSYSYRKKENNLIGFSYYGIKEEYCVCLKDFNITLGEYIGTAFDRYKKLLKERFSKKLDEFKEVLS